jgi:hypothetical protein
VKILIKHQFVLSVIEDASIIVLEGVDADFLITPGEDNWTLISILDNDLVFVNLDLFS